jgi:hypothetical protein
VDGTAGGKDGTCVDDPHAPIKEAHRMTEAKPNYGPAMLALPNDRWRAACIAFIMGGHTKTPGRNNGYTAACRAAGYTEGQGLRVQAYQMFHDARMQAAIQEEAKKRMQGALPYAMDAMDEILANPQHKGHEAIVKTVLDRAGLHAAQEVRHTHELSGLDAASLARARQIADKIGVPLEKLVGRSIAARELAAPVDVPFEVVDDDREPEYVEVDPDNPEGW